MADLSLNNVERTTLSTAFATEGKIFEARNESPEGHSLVSLDRLRNTYCLLTDKNGRNDTSLGRKVSELDRDIKFVPTVALPERHR